MMKEIERLASFVNITGAEGALANYLLDFFQRKKLDAELDLAGNVIVRKKGSGEGHRKRMICTPLDNPGYIALFTEGKNAYLSATDKSLCRLKDVKEVADQDGKTYPLKKSKYQKDNFFVKGEDFKPGKVFRLPSSYSENEDTITGRFAARYALISLLMALASVPAPASCELIFCFTTGFHSFGKAEGNIAFRERPEEIILLGFTEESSEKPILMIKDGKHFSSPLLLQKIKGICFKEGLQLLPKASDISVTKADTVAFPGGGNIISLALPSKSAGMAKETLRKNAYLSLQTLLNSFLQSN